MKIPKIMTALSLCCGLAAVGGAATPEAVISNGESRPNIVLVLADDLGWMDTTVNGSQYYETPNMERLSRQGVRFTNAYTANSMCSPTRASIMTGLYPDRLKLTQPGCHLPETPNDGKALPTGPAWSKTGVVQCARKLDLEQYTIAEALKDGGYDTIFLGKWHLGRDSKYWPDHQGFDINLGGRGDPAPPGGYFNTNKNHLLPKAPKGTHYDDLLSDCAIQYMEKRKDDTDPFFMCLWYYGVHSPWQAKKALVEKYRAKKDPRGVQDCPTMGGMIETLDTGLGRVLDALDANGLTDNTIVIFFSDNGGCEYGVADRTSATNNDPLRGGKGTNWEGGVRVPMLVRWPGKIKPGTVSDEMVCSIDFYPTLLSMAGGITPQKGKVLDGVDLVPLLTGSTSALERDMLYWHLPHLGRVYAHEGANSAVRKGSWKLYRYYYDGPNGTDRYALFNLRDDLGERNDLAERMPEKVAELSAVLDAQLERNGAVIPLKNQNYNPLAVRKPLGLPPARWGKKRLD